MWRPNMMDYEKEKYLGGMSDRAQRQRNAPPGPPPLDEQPMPAPDIPRQSADNTVSPNSPQGALGDKDNQMMKSHSSMMGMTGNSPYNKGPVLESGVRSYQGQNPQQGPEIPLSQKTKAGGYTAYPAFNAGSKDQWSDGNRGISRNGPFQPTSPSPSKPLQSMPKSERTLGPWASKMVDRYAKQATISPYMEQQSDGTHKKNWQVNMPQGGMAQDPEVAKRMKSQWSTQGGHGMTEGQYDALEKKKQQQGKQNQQTPAQTPPASSSPSIQGIGSISRKPQQANGVTSTIPPLIVGDTERTMLSVSVANAVIAKANRRLEGDGKYIQIVSSDANQKVCYVGPTGSMSAGGEGTDTDAIHWRGAWLSTATYSSNDVVTYNHLDNVANSRHGTYISLRTNTNVEPPRGDNRYSDDTEGNHVWAEFSPGHWSRFIVGDVDNADNVVPIGDDCTDIDRGTVTINGILGQNVTLDPMLGISATGDGITYDLPMVTPEVGKTLNIALYPLTICKDGVETTVYFLAGVAEETS